MTAPCRIFDGVKFFRSKIIYTSKKEVETEAKEWEKDGFDTRVLRSTEKIKNEYQYRIYIGYTQEIKEGIHGHLQ